MSPRRTIPAQLGVALVSLVLLFSSSGYGQAQERAQPTFRNGQAQVVEAFADSSEWVRDELWVETGFDSDGDGEPDRMHVSVTRQRQTETQGLKVPVIYGSSPYYSGVAPGDDFFWDVKQEVGSTPPERTDGPSFEAQTQPLISEALVDTWVPRGFAVVHSESPGTGLSEGCPTVGGDNESLAPKAVIDWLNGRTNAFTSADGGEEVVADWTTGKVGMTGTSYNGTLPLAAATTGVEGLEAIIPVAPNTSYYHYYRSNGLVRHPGGYPGEDINVLYDFIHSRADRYGYCNTTVRDSLMAEGLDRASGDYNDFWASRNYLDDLEGMDAAALMAHGLNDWNVMPDHTIRIFKRLKEMDVPAEIYLHRGGHGGPPPQWMMNEWFSKYLYGIDNGVDEAPHAWIVRKGDERTNPTPYLTYPNPDASTVTLHPLAAAGEQHLNGVGGLRLSATPGQGTEMLVDNVSFSGGALAIAEKTSHRLLYASPELTEAVHLSGTAEIEVRIASSKPAANLSVWLVSLPWEEDSQSLQSVITRGWADPQNHASLTHSEPLVPGRFYDLRFDLQPDDQVIEAGERIGLMIFSSDRDFTLWPSPGTELTVDLDAMMLHLPVVGGETNLRRAFGETAP